MPDITSDNQDHTFKCMICECDDFSVLSEELRDDRYTRVVQCSACTHAQLNPLPTHGEIAAYYNSKEHSISKDEQQLLTRKRNAFSRELTRHIKYVTSLMPLDGTLIDIGCGYGFFLQEMAKRGFIAVGVEPSKIRREVARRYEGISVYSSLDDLPYTCVSSVLNLFFVLEHVLSPVAFLHRVKKHLDVDGHLLVVVPNRRDYLLSHNNAYRIFYWKRAHLSYFSIDSLQLCLCNAGFICKEVKYIQRWPLNNAMHWMIHNSPQEPDAILREAGIQSYEWLEAMYEDYLAAIRQTDTLMLRARLES